VRGAPRLRSEIRARVALLRERRVRRARDYAKCAFYAARAFFAAFFFFLLLFACRRRARARSKDVNMLRVSSVCAIKAVRYYARSEKQAQAAGKRAQKIFFWRRRC